MKLTESQITKLSNIADSLLLLKLEVEYDGYDPTRISNENAIGTICSNMIELIETLITDACVDDVGLSSEDYEAIYGWGGQG